MVFAIRGQSQSSRTCSGGHFLLLCFVTQGNADSSSISIPNPADSHCHVVTSVKHQISQRMIMCCIRRVSIKRLSSVSRSVHENTRLSFKPQNQGELQPAAEGRIGCFYDCSPPSSGSPKKGTCYY